MFRKFAKALALLIALCLFIPPFGFSLQAAINAFFIVVAFVTLCSLADSAIRAVRAARKLRKESK